VSPVRILYLADIRFPLERANGIQSMETCHALARRGHDVHMIVRPDTTRPARDPYVFYGLPRIDRLTIERAPVVGPSVARRMGYLAFALGRSIGAGRVDVVLTRDLSVAAALLRAPGALRPPIVYESHGYAPDVASALPALVSTATAPGARKLRRLAGREGAVWRGADGYVTITRGLANELETRFGARAHLAIVPDGVRLQPGTSGPAKGIARSSDRPLVVYAGHLYAWKGVDVLLEALVEVPEADGLIVGGHAKEPDLARVRALADKLGIGSRVRFTGLVDPPDVRALLSQASVLVLPNPASAISTRFTSPLKLFEYMAARRPIVATDLPAMREVLTPDVNAILVVSGSAPALSAGIRRVLSDPELAVRLSEAAATAVLDYTWDRRAERLEALLGSVVGERR
jgi:glycosyltransferase involved in cell wall biosynthesis